ncbi:uncharacterized protein LOC130962759 [Arachis stenosperma]|uniref:uncharacterized protein LOC130962759 n=1 Tax=Arachis stenosperma TaxID=217475 RepID=UPI0025AC6D77|nr:uncharacterized protein LOC130962759 [Arachis stenosperma]
MAEPRRITLQEAGAPDFTMQPYQARHPNLAADFELKTALINLLPKFHGLPTQEPIKHLRNFQTACSTTRQHGVDEVTIWLYAFPFSLEEKAREWFYTQPEAVVTNWKGIPGQVLSSSDAASNGSLTNYKTATEAWQLTTDLAESTRNTRQRNNHPKVITKVSLAVRQRHSQTLGEMSNILKQLQLNQQQPPPPPQQHCQ